MHSLPTSTPNAPRASRPHHFLRLLCVMALLFVAACGDDNNDVVGPDPDPDPDPETNTIIDVAVGNTDLSTLVAALQAAELDDELAGDGPFTVFAPNNDAFTALGEGVVDTLTSNTDVLTKLLQYHVVPNAAVASGDLTDGQQIETLAGDTLTVSIGDDGGVSVNGVAVTQADVQADNGVVHIIDGVLTQNLNVVERARITPDLSTLVTAIQAANLADALSNEDEIYTVFAPTNAAFDALPDGTLDDLLADPDALSNVLLYHVVNGAAVFSTDLSDGMMVENMADGELTIGVGDAVTVTGAQNTATVVTPDVDVSNGVVHVIDAVLLPPEDDDSDGDSDG